MKKQIKELQMDTFFQQEMKKEFTGETNTTGE